MYNQGTTQIETPKPTIEDVFNAAKANDGEKLISYLKGNNLLYYLLNRVVDDLWALETVNTDFFDFFLIIKIQFILGVILRE